MLKLRQLFRVISLIIFFAPGAFIAIHELAHELGQTNPFITVFLIVAGGIVSIIGLIVFLITATRFRQKVFTLIFGIFFYLLLFPMIWGINSIREKQFLHEHHTLLETIATQTLAHELSIEEANALLHQHDLNLKIYCIPDDKSQVLYILQGMLDNCYGFAFNPEQKSPPEYCIGDLTQWKELEKNWYIWGAT